MKLADLAGKNVCILGYGREGQAMLGAIERAGIDCAMTVADQNPQTELQTTNYKLQTGPDYLRNLDHFDVIIRSPGIFPCKELKAVQDRITNSTQIFLEEAIAKGATVIGVTGSKGKSTTASLIYAILRTGEKDVSLVGNIGEPAISHVKEANPNKFFVQEMSSYQLMDLTSSPRIAVVTAFFPEHLNYHGSLEAYRDAKTNITRFQKEGDIVFFNAQSEGARAIAKEGKGEKCGFTLEDAPIGLTETKLIGAHNLGNIAAAFLVGKHLGIPDDVSKNTIREFKSLPHRLQPCGEHHGIEWVDDAISTTPESTIAALDALGKNVATLILGGQDRGNDFSELADRIARSSIGTVILTGESGQRIRVVLERATALVNIYEAASMKEAVSLARTHTQVPSPKSQVPICLLSPASPSYGMFKNFEERGTAFLEAILS
ncbi:MAG: UDP-N-acetylmuramoyl-L-alanine--D-glutamate ligase [Candidatus Peribacteraceae bacterium]|nr:UDP-N-acetylmuramoyl-L-alanine--D-glutamate ligase [Candidatus Peribacteraceae bacterium]